MNRAIIVAAGQGLRMHTDRRKQFLYLSGQPILMHTLCIFDACCDIDQLIVVVPSEEIPYCQEKILKPAGLDGEVSLVAGGKRRQDSVYNGLASIADDNGIVLIHDGVRPLVSKKIINACIQGALRWGSCIPVIPPVDTPKQVNETGVISRTIDRKVLRMAQTPQAFQLPIIRKAHQTAIKNGWQATDDASLVERLGLDVHIVQGMQENLKITTAQDMALAQFYLSQRCTTEDGL
jgi:2-C-methyl-D-erythritol 4-phosphate cytidylyltransferase